MTNSGFWAEIALEQPELVFFPVPWDEGFTACVNGEEADLLCVDNGLMAVPCPAGESRVDLVYAPAGLPLSRAVTLAALPVWLAYTGYFAWKRRRG